MPNSGIPGSWLEELFLDSSALPALLVAKIPAFQKGLPKKPELDGWLGQRLQYPLGTLLK